MYAVIETGGKQYRVEVGTVLAVERIQAEPGQQLDLGRVLLVADGDGTAVGRPVVDGARVTASILRQDRADKIVVFKYGPKTRRRVKKGHRQEQTVLRIDDIVHGDRSAAAQAEAERAEQQRRAAEEAEAASAKAAADKAIAEKLAAGRAAAAAAAAGTEGAAAGKGAAPAKRATASKPAKPAARPAAKAGAKTTPKPAAKAKTQAPAPETKSRGTGGTKKTPKDG
jgi:large subunit ribosomal protein L21